MPWLVYGNEDSVGVAIRESGLSRKELYITTKYDGGDVREEIETSLKKVYSYRHQTRSIHLTCSEAWRQLCRLIFDSQPRICQGHCIHMGGI